MSFVDAHLTKCRASPSGSKLDPHSFTRLTAPPIPIRPVACVARPSNSGVLSLNAELPSDEPPVAGVLQLRGSFPGICPAGRCPRIAITNSRSGCGAPGGGRETSARFLRGAHAFASSPAVADVATERHSDAASEPASERPVPRDTLANRPDLPCLIA